MLPCAVTVVATAWPCGVDSSANRRVAVACAASAAADAVTPGVAIAPGPADVVIFASTVAHDSHNLAVVYDRTAYFTVEVQREAQPVEEHIFNGLLIGSSDGVIGEIPTPTGRLNIPILSRNDRVTIDLVNSSWLPSNFVSATWRGRWTQTAREV